MLWDSFHWVVSLIEVLVVIASILALGLTLAGTLLWSLGRLEGPPPQLDSDQNEVDHGIPEAEQQP